jgi:hypothetical protein
MQKIQVILDEFFSITAVYPITSEMPNKSGSIINKGRIITFARRSMLAASTPT